jgi:hypothetical protein
MFAALPGAPRIVDDMPYVMKHYWTSESFGPQCNPSRLLPASAHWRRITAGREATPASCKHDEQQASDSDLGASRARTHETK